jgi:hypothetical protein
MLLSNAKKHIHSVLTILGVVPFIGCALLLHCDITTWPYGGQVATTMNVYGLLIASFLAGSHWGMTLSPGNVAHPFVAFFSNVMVVILWLSYSILSTSAMFIVESVILGVLLMQERLTWGIQRMPAGYASIRLAITILVMVLLLLTANILW